MLSLGAELAELPKIAQQSTHCANRSDLASPCFVSEYSDQMIAATRCSPACCLRGPHRGDAVSVCALWTGLRVDRHMEHDCWRGQEEAGPGGLEGTERERGETRMKYS